MLRLTCFILQTVVEEERGDCFTVKVVANFRGNPRHYSQLQVKKTQDLCLALEEQ